MLSSSELAANSRKIRQHTQETAHTTTAWRMKVMLKKGLNDVERLDDCGIYMVHDR